jgi:hypothetical protein
LTLANSEATADDASFEPHTITQMALCLAGSLNLFRGEEQTFDKSESIQSINSLVKRLISVFVRCVLKNKSNLNQNEYILKSEIYLVCLNQLFRAMLDFSRPSTGVWRGHEYRWIDSQILEDLFSIYAYLVIKPPEIEAMYRDYLKICMVWMKKRIFNQ